MLELAFVCRYVQVLTTDMVRDIVGNVCNSGQSRILRYAVWSEQVGAFQ